MPREEFENKLTPAARQALDELVSDYRSQLLLGARDSAARLGDLRELSVHDIMAGFGRVQSRLTGASATAVERLLSTYLWGGALVGLGGLLTYMIRELLANRNFVDQLPLVASIAGFAMAALSYTYLRMRRSRAMRLAIRRSDYFESPDALGAFIARWRELELAIRRIASEKLGESAAAAPISTLIESLAERGIVTLEDSVKLRGLASLRNQIVHGGQQIPLEAVSSAMRDVERVARRLSSGS